MTKKEISPTDHETQKKTVFPARYILVLLGFLGFFNVYAMRVNLSVALVAMVNKSMETTPDINSKTTIVCSNLLSTNNSTMEKNKQIGEFSWNPTQQGLILGSFFYGYILTQIPGGILAEWKGTKWLYGIGVLVTSIFTLLTPIAAYWGETALVVVRVIEGLGEGVTIPAMNALLGRWAPKMERSRMATMVYSGFAIGTVAAMSVTGLLSDTSFLGGWPSTFYIFGFLGCLWFIFWIFFAYDAPDSHPRITKSELIYIKENQDREKEKKEPIPWKSILTSVPVWALAITHFGQNWGFYTLLTEMPTYLSNVLHFDIEANGILSALPHLLQAVFGWLASIIADKIRKSEKLRISSIRKIFNSIAFFGPGICTLAVAFVGCRPVIILTLLSVSMGLNGLIFSGFYVTHVDMSPQHAGTLMGITNCVGSLPGFLAPAVIGWIIQGGQTLHNWGLVFVISSCIYFISGIIYNLFCTAERQSW